MLKNNLQKNKNKREGFTILIAVIAASILLIVAMTIGGIALKEQILSTANKESQIAYYAADTGMECALYWDQKKGLFAPVTQFDGSVANRTDSVNVTCNGATFSAPVTSISISPNQEYSYSFEVSGIPVEGGTQGTTCAIVTITKDTNDSQLYPAPTFDPTRTHTTIQSYGYNTCAASLSRLERGIIGSY